MLPIRAPLMECFFSSVADPFKPRKPEHFKRQEASDPHLIPQHKENVSPHEEKVLRRHQKQEERDENALKAEKLNPNNPKYHSTSGTGAGRHGATTFGGGTKGEGNPSGGWLQR